MLIEAIHTAADFGDVLPLTAERKPACGWCRATADPDAIAALWDEFPGAGVGLCAFRWVGGATPLAPVDEWEAVFLAVDVEHERKKGEDGYATLERLQVELGELPPTRTHSTKSGGEHRMFRLPRGLDLRSSTGGNMRRNGLPSPGVDFVTGRSILRWAAPGYAIKQAGPGFTMDGGGGCALLPERWIAELEEPPPALIQPMHFDQKQDALNYALAALKGETRKLAECGAQRNPQLFASAAAIGQLCPPLEEDWIFSALLGACEINGLMRDPEHGQRDCRSTIRRGIRTGQKTPRTPK